MNRRSAILGLMLSAAALGATAPEAAFAQAQRGGDSLGSGWREQQDQVQRGVREGRFVSLAQVIQTLRRRTPGRQLDAGLEGGPAGRPVYRVRWAADDGRRIDYLVDAETGAILKGD